MDWPRTWETVAIKKLASWVTPEARFVPFMRTNGVLMAIRVPSGGIGSMLVRIGKELPLREDTVKRKLYLALFALVLAGTSMYGQNTEQAASARKFYVGSTFVLLGNFIPNDPNPPGYFQLNFGYRLSPRQVVGLELKTWKYAWPLGIPYGKSREAAPEKYPGHVRTFGLEFVYQRFLWKGLYAAVHAMNGFQQYVGEDHRRIQSGYQLFLTYRLGYHIPLFGRRFFIEPSLAMTHWPINTNVPESFAKVNKKWPNYFFVEPGLHFGYSF